MLYDLQNRVKDKKNGGIVIDLGKCQGHNSCATCQEMILHMNGIQVFPLSVNTGNRKYCKFILYPRSKVWELCFLPQ